MKGTRRFSPLCVTAVILLTTLFGCMPNPLKVTEAPLSHGDNFIFINSLHCNRDHTVAAMGFLGNPYGQKGTGIALHSDDQGLTWRRIDLSPGADSVSVSFVVLPVKGPGSSDQLYASGYVVGNFSLSQENRPGPWWISADGGRSWLQSSPLYPLPVSNIPFYLTSPGALPVPLRPISIVNEQGTLLTIRGGTDNQHSFILGKSSADTLLRSTDGGKNWESSPSHNISNLRTLLTNGRGHAVVAGWSGKEPGKTVKIFWSDDSGENWTLASCANPLPAVWDAVAGSFRIPIIWLYGNPDQPIIAYSGASIYRSEDRGRTWQGPLNLKAESSIAAMMGNGKGRFIALMTLGPAMVSNDWGKTWERRDTGVQVALPAKKSIAEPLPFASLISTENGLLVGIFTGVRFTRSTDWGETWHPVDSQLPEKQYSLRASCSDGRGLMVVGGDWGMLTRSIDGGATWQRGRMAEKP